MCRFVAYLGEEIPLRNLVTDPVNSVIHQSYKSQERKEPLNGDGFGIAWYAPKMSHEPAVFKDVSPAWNNVNLFNLARVTRSSCVFAHIRAATPGMAVTRPNCHPFSWGPFAFMHNGTLAGFRHTRRRLLESLSDEAFQGIQGTTDSEYLFALFTDHYRKTPRTGEHIEAMAEALKATIAEAVDLTRRQGVEGPSYLNLAVTDGRCAVVSRYISSPDLAPHSLYYHAGKRYVCEGGVCRMVQPEEDRGAVLVASEPLSGEEGWTPVTPNSLVLVSSRLDVEVRGGPL